MDYTVAWTPPVHPGLTDPKLAEHLRGWGYEASEAEQHSRALFAAIERCRDGLEVPRPTWRNSTPNPCTCVYYSEDEVLVTAALVLWTPLILLLAMLLGRKAKTPVPVEVGALVKPDISDPR
jgi:hypothetical protein